MVYNQQGVGLQAVTIVAPATPAGRGGVGVVRISGAKTREIADKILKRKLSPRHASAGNFYANNSDEIIDFGIAILFIAPHSFTGEDVLELQCHGGPVIIDQLVALAVSHGARLARPGEFSERAFLNDKIDLVQAEGIAQLINANSIQASRAAQRTLRGEFSKEINSIVNKLTNLRVHIEALLDFPEEEINLLENKNIINNLEKNLKNIINNAEQGVKLADGCNIAIVGKPNSGKSSLLNKLAKHDAAIVTNIPGTTRDVLRQTVLLDGYTIQLADTAGIRDSDDVVELEGIKRAKQELKTADLVLLIKDINDTSLDIYIPEDKKIIYVYNKIDLINKKPEIKDNKVYLSAKTGDGLNLLQKLLQETLKNDINNENVFIAKRRHVTALENSLNHIVNAKNQLAAELMAEELKLAQNALGEITGVVTSDALLGKIFSEFCIGK